MSKSKKYYWLKIETDFFNQKEIKKLRRIAGGDTYTIIYLKMALLSLKDEGLLYYEGIEKDIAEELSLELDEEVENIRVVINYLQAHNMLKVTEENDLYMSRIKEMTGSETESAKKMRRSRGSKKELEGHNVTQLLPDVTKSDSILEKDKEKEKEKDKDNKKDNKKDIDDFFEKVWKLYPRKEGKGSISKTQKNKLFALGEELERCIERYKEKISKEQTDKKFIKQGSTFFNSGYIDYLDENFEEQKQVTVPKKKKLGIEPDMHF